MQENESIMAVRRYLLGMPGKPLDAKTVILVMDVFYPPIHSHDELSLLLTMRNGCGDNDTQTVA